MPLCTNAYKFAGNECENSIKPKLASSCEDLIFIEWFAVNQPVWSVDGYFVQVYGLLLLLLLLFFMWLAIFYSLA